MHVIALLIAIISSSVPAKVKNSARAQAREVTDALVRGDFERVVELTHPRIVVGIGGREPMIQALGAGFSR